MRANMRADLKPAPTIMEIVVQNGRHLLGRVSTPVLWTVHTTATPKG